MNTYILAIIFFSITFNAQAQRMVAGQKAVELSAGTMISRQMDYDYFINLGMTINSKSRNYFLFAAEYNRMRTAYKEVKIPVENYLAEAGYSIRLLSDRKKSFGLHTGFSGLVGYESINRGDSVLFDGASILNKGGLIYGGTLRVSAELYISDRIVLMAQARNRVVFNTSVSRFRPSAGVGLRFNF